MAIDITGTIGDDVINDTVPGAINAPGGVSAVQSVNITGLSGFDKIYGSTNADTLFGNAGDDLILGNGGSDTIYGGQGNDTLYVTGVADTTTEPATSVRSVVSGGQGLDQIFVGGGTEGRNDPSNFGGVFTGQVTVFGGSDGVDQQDQGDFIDVRLGVDSRAEVYGNGGNDTIEALGSDRFLAGQAASQFYIHGGQGNDAIEGFVGSASTVLGGVGADQIEIAAINSVTVYGGNGNADAIDGNDVISVQIGNGAFAATGAVPTADLFGNGGNDQIFLNVFGGAEVKANIYGGQGTDLIVAGNLGDGSYIVGGIGSDVIEAFVTGENVSIVGGNGTTDPADGTDIIYVGIDEDASAQIFGNGGDDFLLVYGEGSATVFGGAGDDTFVIGNQNDDQNFFPESVVLTGGLGSDLYQIDARQDNRDVAPVVRITDFNFDEDRIAGDQVDDLVAVSGRANNFQDIVNLSSGALGVGDAALVTVNSGALSGTYLAYQTGSETQIINITGYTGTADADVFTNPVGLPLGGDAFL